MKPVGNASSVSDKYTVVSVKDVYNGNVDLIRYYGEYR